MIRPVDDCDLGRVRAFLEAHLDSSLFLLSNLAVCGPRAGTQPNSGTFRVAEDEGRIVAVFCLTRRGNLLVQAGGRADLAANILEACEGDGIELTGVMGEWETSQALWRLVCADPGFAPSPQNNKDVLYGRPLTHADLADADLADSRAAVAAPIRVRALTLEDFAQWEPLTVAYGAELDLRWKVGQRQRREEFDSRVRERRWWGAFEANRLLSIAGLNAVYARLGQVGGVYTLPEARRSGLGRLVMRGLMSDSRRFHRFDRLVLFTGEGNGGARRLYESLDFKFVGAYGLFVGTRRPG